MGACGELESRFQEKLIAFQTAKSGRKKILVLLIHELSAVVRPSRVKAATTSGIRWLGMCVWRWLIRPILTLKRQLQWGQSSSGDWPRREMVLALLFSCSCSCIPQQLCASNHRLTFHSGRGCASCSGFAHFPPRSQDWCLSTSERPSACLCISCVELCKSMHQFWSLHRTVSKAGIHLACGTHVSCPSELWTVERCVYASHLKPSGGPLCLGPCSTIWREADFWGNSCGMSWAAWHGDYTVQVSQANSEEGWTTAQYSYSICSTKDWKASPIIRFEKLTQNLQGQV